MSSAGEYRARILWESDPADRTLLTQLRSDPTVTVVDHGDALWAQYVSLLPVGPPVPDETTAPPEMPWAWFPWRRSVTRLLGPTEYRHLRLDRNRNKITRTEQDALAALNIGVVGLSVGHAIAHTIALEGLCGRLRLADFDAIELSNLNRIPASVLDIGVNKAVVVARRIAEIDPYLPVEVFSDGLTEHNLDAFFDGLDVVIEECDSLDIKLKLRLEARRRGIPVLMETSDRGLFDVERFDLEPERALFHGLLGAVDPDSLRDLSTRDKAPHVMRILEAVDLSPRMAASMVEIDQTLNSWPQLGGDVQLGAATVAAAVRRLGRGEALPSGRIRIDLDEQLAGLSAARIAPPVMAIQTADAVIDERPTSAMEAAIQAIRLAPSGGNSQPWLIRPAPDTLQIDLATDRTSAMDIHFRGSLVAIGAGTFNARVALASNGLAADVEFHSPTVENPLTATISIQPGDDTGIADLQPAMVGRISNRNTGQCQSISPSVHQRLTAAAETEGGSLRLITDRMQIASMAGILAESDRIRYLTPVLHSQMMSELKWPGVDELESGIDVRTLGLDEADLAKLLVAERADVMAYLRSWGAGKALGDNTRDRVLAASAVAVVTVRGTAAADYLRGGAAMQRLWITAELNGLAIAPISPVFLYARGDADLCGVSEHFAAELSRLQDEFTTLIDCPPGESVILVMRAVHRAGPTRRSERLRRSLVVADSPEPAHARVGHSRRAQSQEKLDR